MADLQEICEGIAANIATIRDADPSFFKQVSPFPLENPTGPSLMVHGVIEMEYTTFGSPAVAPGMRYLIAVEAWLGKASDIGGHTKLRRLLASQGDESLVAAVEAAGTPLARLTSRLDHNGVLLEDQSPACDSIAFEEYRGHQNFLGGNQIIYLIATWIFEVITSS